MASWTVSHSWGRYDNMTVKHIFDPNTYPDATSDARAETRRLLHEALNDLFEVVDVEAATIEGLEGEGSGE